MVAASICARVRPVNSLIFMVVPMLWFRPRVMLT
jgi:hypothetical protein